ncbi:Tonsoku-like protein [Anabarilius grahami]|uniref:Tonsoku-like protein n=1 Tax=Anabarilius grahami TaxID=495550 RepID=A0A3N0XVT1_ANAGA|nr:Tonsoku-like protein [Anabarilius grahami]
MHNLGSAKSCLLSQSLSEPVFTSTPAVSANSRSALVPEEQYLAGDWLEDDLSDVQPKKKRRVSEHNIPRETTFRNHNHFSVSAEASPRASFQNRTAHVPSPIRMRVRVQDCLPDSSSSQVLAEVCSWDLPPLPERYRKAYQSLGVEENRRVSRLCEVQDSSSCVNVCGLSLSPASLTPLLRALKLQASLTELRITANRLNNDLLPEMMSAVATAFHIQLTVKKKS